MRRGSWTETSGLSTLWRQDSGRQTQSSFLTSLSCAVGWRAIRRSPERADFWRWVLDYRRRNLRRTMESIAASAANADIHVIRNPAALRRFVSGVGSV